MDKQTKMWLGIGAVAVALYLILKPKGTNSNSSVNQPPCDPNNLYCDYIIPKGTTFKNAEISSGISRIKETPKNQFDVGVRSMKKDDFKILSIIKDGKPLSDFQKPFTKDGFTVYDGAIADIVTTKDVTANYQQKQVIYTGAIEDANCDGCGQNYEDMMASICEKNGGNYDYDSGECINS